MNRKVVTALVIIILTVSSIMYFAFFRYTPSEPQVSMTTSTIGETLIRCEYLVRGDFFGCLPKNSTFSKTSKHFEIFTVQYRVEGVLTKGNRTTLNLDSGTATKTLDLNLNVSGIRIGNIIAVTYNKTFSDFELFAKVDFYLVSDKLSEGKCQYYSSLGEAASMSIIVEQGGQSRLSQYACLAPSIKSGELIWNATTPIDTIPIEVKILA